METRDTNRVNMIRTTNNYCSNNTTATSGITAFAGVLSTSGNKLTLIDQLNQISSGESEGVTLDTKALRETVCNIGFKVAGATYAWASSVKKNAIMAKVNYPRSKFDLLAKEDVDDACQTIYDATEPHITEVTNFGIDPTDLSDLQTAIILYRQSMQEPRQFIIDRKDANRRIKKLLKEIINVTFKTQMDKMVNTLRYTNEVFYEKYYGARETIDLGTTTTKIRGTISDDAGAPLQGASLILRLTGQSAIAYEDTTNAEGEFNISHITPENYDIEASHTGCQNHSETDIHFSPGNELSRNITLSPSV